MGFKSIGVNAQISDKAVFYGINNISIGDNSRIDDFCILSAGPGGITIGRNVHIACYVSLIGKEEITIADFAGLSSKCSVYSSSDDYSGNAMSNPTVPAKYTNVDSRPVHIGKHVLVGAGSIILPGVIIGDYSAVGAASFVRKPIPLEGIISSGNPLRSLSQRNKEKLIELECQYLSEK
jgi:galactoside O-acetyltransferase